MAKKGEKLTQEQLAKRFGRKASEETKAKMSASSKGKKKPPISEEHRKNIGLAGKGRKISAETLAKYKAKKVSVETRNLISNAMKGDKTHLWRGGIANFRSSLRTTFLYRTWRSDVLTRDDFTCQICFIRGGKLNVDHIKAFSIILDENNIKTHEDAASCDELWNINNGRVLCVSCHKQTDNFGYKASNLNKRTKS